MDLLSKVHLPTAASKHQQLPSNHNAALRPAKPVKGVKRKFGDTQQPRGPAQSAYGDSPGPNGSPYAPVTVLRWVMGTLRGRGFANVQPIFYARIPVLRFTDPKLDLTVDIAHNNNHDFRSDNLLLAYQYLQTLPKLAEGPANKLWIIPSELTEALKGIGTAFGQAGAGETASLTDGRRASSRTAAWPSTRPRTRCSRSLAR